MEKNKVTVFVAGQKLTLITQDSEKHVMDIAQKVDTTINSLLSSSNMSREKCAVMAALDFCDDEYKTRAQLNEVKEQIKDYIEYNSKLSAEIETLKAEVKKLNGEKNELLTSKKTLVAQSVDIKKEKIEIETEETTKTESDFDSSDDLSFDFDEKPKAVVEQPIKASAQNSQNTQKSDKKRHNHNHVNPYKERFLKQQNEQQGYTPTRQYSLFDE